MNCQNTYMAELNLLKARKKNTLKNSSITGLPILVGIFKLLIACLLTILLLYLFALTTNYILRQQVTASEKASVKQFSSTQTKPNAKAPAPYATDTEIASLAAQIPLQEKTQQSLDISLIPTDLLTQITDEVAKITIYRLVDVLSGYWVDTQHFPISNPQDAHAWIQQMQDLGDISSLYATYLSKINADPSLCNSASQNGLCYISNGQKAILSIPLQSAEEKSLCPHGAVFFAWSSEGKVGVTCR